VESAVKFVANKVYTAKLEQKSLTKAGERERLALMTVDV
jgi:hypothetical protein